MSFYLQNDVSRSQYCGEIYAFIVVANISAALHDAQKEAKNLSLTAKNARALAIRAGELAAGFKVITNFIDEFANKTISFANSVGELSQKIAIISHDASTINNLQNRLRVAQKQVEDECGKATIQGLIDDNAQKLDHYQNEFSGLRSDLELLLNDIVDQMRAATFIASTSKVEAVQAGDYKEGLDAVAVGVTRASETISHAARHCLHCLKEI